MPSFRNIWIVYKREMRAYFTSLLAYLIVASFVLASMTICFIFGGLLESQDASLSGPFFQFMPWLFMFFGPAIGMGVWSEEQRQGTIELLLTMPITIWEAMTGKFLAACTIIALALVLTFPVILTVTYLGDPDMGRIWSGYIGAFLVGCASVAITCVISAIFRSQIITVIIGIFLCFVLTVCGARPVLEAVKGAGFGWLASFFDTIGLLGHSFRMSDGLMRLDALFYFLSLTAFCLFATSAIIKAKRA